MQTNRFLPLQIVALIHLLDNQIDKCNIKKKAFDPFTYVWIRRDLYLYFTNNNIAIPVAILLTWLV